MDRVSRRESAPSAWRRLKRSGGIVAAIAGLTAAAIWRTAPESPVVEPGQEDVQAVPAGASADRRTVDAAPERGSLAKRAEHPFQRELVAMPDAERRSVLRLAIGDRHLACDEVVDVAALADGMPVWRVACSGAHAYLVEVDELGRIVIEPQFYHEPTVVPPRRGTPSDGSGLGPERREPPPFDRFR